jgi:cyclophilin family peptidyl-prolyl cis-trans isomerase
MEGQKNSWWPMIVLIIIIIIAVIVGWYFYPKERAVVSDTTGISNPLFTTTENSINNNPNMNTSSEKVLVTLKTNQGDIILELYADKAPKTVANFVKLAQDNFYNGILFHRVIKGFMIQGGDPLTKSEPTNWGIHGTGGPGYKFADEQNDIRLERGVIAMANSGLDTNGSQFFIMTARQPMQLAGYYTAFGRVVGGMEVVDKIEVTPVNGNDHPLADMVITAVEVK